MNDFKETRRLIRLKRYEQPPQDYHDNFLDEFRERQRSEILRRSSMRLFLERLSTFISEIGKSRWVIGCVLIYGLVAFLLMINRQADNNDDAVSSDAPMDSASPPEVSPLLDPRIDILKDLAPVTDEDESHLFQLDHKLGTPFKEVNGVIIGL